MTTDALSNPAWIAVPAGTKEARCTRCGHPIYWVHREGGIRFAVDCDQVTGSIFPSAEYNEASGRQSTHWDGSGVSHFSVCKGTKPLRSAKGAR